jgi:hypothetical protein
MTKPSASCGPYGIRIIEVSLGSTMQELPAAKTHKSDEEIDRRNSRVGVRRE